MTTDDDDGRVDPFMATVLVLVLIARGHRSGEHERLLVRAGVVRRAPSHW